MKAESSPSFITAGIHWNSAYYNMTEFIENCQCMLVEIPQIDTLVLYSIFIIYSFEQILHESAWVAKKITSYIVCFDIEMLVT